MKLPIQSSAVLRGNSSVGAFKALITPSRDCEVCENPCKPWGSCRVCWNDPVCVAERSACRTACRSAQAGAVSACAAGGLSGPVAAAQAAAAFQAGEECFNGC